MTDKRLAALIGIVILVGATIGLAIRPSGLYEAPAAPSTTDVRVGLPPAEPATAAHTAAATYVAVAASCRTPGHTSIAYCWWGGYAFARKTVCVAYSVPGTPIAAILKTYTDTAGIRLVDGHGNCGALGFKASQSIGIKAYTAADKAGPMRGACAYTQAGSYGNLTSVYIRINVTGVKRTACGGDAEWTDVFNHEVGHAFGLTHNQPKVTSIMRDGHSLDTNDRSELTILYGKRKA